LLYWQLPIVTDLSAVSCTFLSPSISPFCPPIGSPHISFCVPHCGTAPLLVGCVRTAPLSAPPHRSLTPCFALVPRFFQAHPPRLSTASYKGCVSSPFLPSASPRELAQHWRALTRRSTSRFPPLREARGPPRLVLFFQKKMTTLVPFPGKAPRVSCIF